MTVEKQDDVRKRTIRIDKWRKANLNKNIIKIKFQWIN